MTRSIHRAVCILTALAALTSVALLQHASAQKDPPDSYYWGIGIYGDKGCSNCCYTAGDVYVGLTLVCN